MQQQNTLCLKWPLLSPPHKTCSTHLGGLLLEGVQDAVDELLLEPRVDVCGPEVAHDLLYRLHHHLPVLFRLILQVVHNAAHNLRSAHLVRNLHCRVDELCNKSERMMLCLLYNVLATSKIISGRALTCDSVHTWRLYSAAPLGDQAISPCPILLMPNIWLGSDMYHFLKSLV